MDDCVSSHQLLHENYIVQPVENISVSMINYDKVEMNQLIHSGPLTNGASGKIQKSNYKTPKAILMQLK